MYKRIIQLPEKMSFFLFGARGTGKSTLLEQFSLKKNSRVYDLLDLDLEAKLARNPMSLESEILGAKPALEYVIIDEIQKLPKLLDVVHRLIAKHKVTCQFILTGSSARKLKKGAANLLAGRAIERQLFPLTPDELGADFNLQDFLQYGSLPIVVNCKNLDLKNDILSTYANTYLKEEIWSEQLVKNLDPFRRFSEVAALQSGEIINFSSIGEDAGVTTKTVQNWFTILEDTLLGFWLPAYYKSVRKQIREAPKFYFLDTGVTRALAQMLSVVPSEKTSYFGTLFENFFVSQLHIKNKYYKLEYKFYYLLTKSDVEIDLIIERPNKSTIVLEIKSTTDVLEKHCKTLEDFYSDFIDADFYLVSRDPQRKKIGNVICMPWYEALLEI